MVKCKLAMNLVFVGIWAAVCCSDLVMAQEVGVGQPIVIDENTTVLVGAMTVQEDTPLVLDVFLDGLDVTAELIVDSTTGEFTMMVEGENIPHSALFTGGGTSGGETFAITAAPGLFVSAR